jgi:hypothetical protein
MSEEYIKALTDALDEIIGSTAIEFPESVDQNDPATRRKIAELVISQPENFKVCCGCEGVIRERAAVCPQCNSYRFETDTDVVKEQALILASRLPNTWFNL